MAAFAAAVGRLRAAVDAAVGGAGDASAAADEIARAITTDPDKDALTQATRASLEPAMEGALGALEARAAATLDVTLELVARDLADPRLPLTLVEDMLESRVTSECETLFMLLEARRSALLTVVGGSTNAKLVFLRACNELLRRLSKTKNTNFCGRILMLMAYLLPLSERSGVNVKGAVNVNPLELDETAEPSDAAAETDGTGAPASAGGAPSLGAPADGEFYRTFWGVQAAFQQPALALADADAWAATCRRLQTILGAFQASSTRDAPDTRVAGRGGAGGEAEAFRRAGDLAREIDVVAARVAEEARAQAAAAAAASSTPAAAGSASGGAQPKRYSSEVYFSKFLTSARLIGLQVRDSYFRRHILAQVCAFCQTVCVSSTKAAPMASVEQQADARKIASDASSLLAATGPCAPRFAETVASLLRSEEHWVAWKRDGCPVFERKRAADLPPAAPAVDASRKRASFAQEEGKAAEKRRRVQLGSVELTRLWNLGGDSLEELAKQAERSSVPTLEAYLAPVLQQMDPSEGIEAAFKKCNDKAYAWKALRLMHRTDLQLDDKYVRGGLEAVAAAVAGIEPKPEAQAPAADAAAAPAAAPAAPEGSAPQDDGGADSVEAPAGAATNAASGAPAGEEASEDEPMEVDGAGDATA